MDLHIRILQLKL